MLRPKALQMWLVVFFGVVLAEDLLPECPKPEAIYPCTCQEKVAKQEVSCERLSNQDQIYGLARGLNGYKIDLLSLHQIEISKSLEFNSFVGTSVKQIDISFSQISLKSPQFFGLEAHLERINLRRSFDSANSLGTLTLGHMSKLDSLWICYNDISELTDGWLASAPDSLKDLNLFENGLTNLGEHAFANIPSLSSISLNDNKLTSMKRSMFPRPANKLTSINLSKNQLSHLPADFFVEMPKLVFVEITNNKFTTLEQSTWSDILPQLYNLDVEDNPLRCDSEMNWLLTSRAWKKFVTVAGTCNYPLEMKGKSIGEVYSPRF